MDVQLTPDQKDFIRQAIESGRFRRPADALHEAMSLWEERERQRAEIQAAIDAAEISLELGKGRAITPAAMRSLANDVKRRGRARLQARQRPGR